MSNIPAYRREVEEFVKKTVDEYGKVAWELDYKIVDKQDKQDALIDGDHPRFTKTLQARTESVGIENAIGKTRTVIKEGAKKDQSGFYCQLCDELATDSISWIDHLNSKKHNRLLGMNLKVDKSSLSEVQQKMKSLLPQKQKNQIEETPKISIEDIKAKFEEQQKRKQQKKEKKKIIKGQVEEGNEGESDQDLKQFLGGGKRVKQ